jgi:hypothetical protein
MHHLRVKYAQVGAEPQGIRLAQAAVIIRSRAHHGRSRGNGIPIWDTEQQWEAPSLAAAWSKIRRFGWPREDIRKHEDGGTIYLDAGGWDELVGQAVAELKRTPHPAVREVMVGVLRPHFAGNTKAWKRVLDEVEGAGRSAAQRGPKMDQVARDYIRKFYTEFQTDALIDLDRERPGLKGAAREEEAHKRAIDTLMDQAQGRLKSIPGDWRAVFQAVSDAVQGL